MKRRIARALAAEARELLLDGELDEARARIEQAPGALEHDKVRHVYAEVLIDQGDEGAAATVLAENVRRDPDGRYAVNAFLHFDWQSESAAPVCALVSSSQLGSTSIFEGRAAADLLKGDDFDGAFERAKAAIDQASGPQQAHLRASLAMLFNLRGRLDLAQRLVMLGHQGELYTAMWDLVTVRKVGALDEVTRTLLGALATSPDH